MKKLSVRVNALILRAFRLLPNYKPIISIISVFLKYINNLIIAFLLLLSRIMFLGYYAFENYYPDFIKMEYRVEIPLE